MSARTTNREVVLPIVTITPDDAYKWLERNKLNRAVRQNKVDYYALMMKRGEWREDREPIEFDNEGRLVNGQHRLFAIIESNVTIRSTIRFGVAEEDIAVIDTGLARTAGDLLRIKGGYKNTTLLAATAKLYWAMLNMPGMYMTNNTRKNLSHEAIERIVSNTPALTVSVNFIKTNSGAYKHLSPSAMSAIHAIISENYSAEKADDFFVKLINGYDLAPGNPIVALRNALANHYGGLRPTRVEIKIAWTVIAFKKWIEGKQLRQMKISHQKIIDNYPQL